MKSIVTSVWTAVSILSSLTAAEAPTNATTTSAGVPIASVSHAQATLTRTSQTEGGICMVYFDNVDLPGNDLYSFQTSEKGVCEGVCLQEDPNCLAWTWFGNTCWIKGGHGSGVFFPGASAGYRISSCWDAPDTDFFLVMENCDARGNDVSNYAGRSYWDCMRIVQSSFTWSDYNGGTCWYKSVVTQCDHAPNKFTALRYGTL